MDSFHFNGLILDEKSELDISHLDEIKKKIV